jgi:hypothetical protein
MHYTPRELVESRLGPGGTPAVIAQQEHPARFMPLAHIDPRDQAWKDELTRCIGDYGFTGLARARLPRHDAA